MRAFVQARFPNETKRQREFVEDFWRREADTYPERLAAKRQLLKTYVEANPHMREHLNDWKPKEKETI